MKEKLKNGQLLRKWFDTQSPLVITRPALRETLRCGACLLGGLLLSHGTMAGLPVPFALSLLAVLGGGLQGLSCLVGAGAGFLLFQPFSQGLELLSAAILIFVCTYIFGSLWVTRRIWFPCVVAGLMTLLVGGIFLLSQPVTLENALGFGRTVLLAGCMPAAYDCLLKGRWRSLGGLIASVSFLSAAAAIPLPLGMGLGCVGGVAFTGAAIRREDVTGAAAAALGAGLALDASLGGGFWTVVLGCGGLFGAAVRIRGLRIAVFLAAMAAAMLFLGQSTVTLWGTLLLGTLFSLPVPAEGLYGQENSQWARRASLAEERLRSGQSVLRRLYDAVGTDPDSREDRVVNQIFDRAAARVCRRCAKRQDCWEEAATENYRLLRPALSAMLDRGAASESDFPEEFDCLHREALAEAVGEGLAGAAVLNRAEARRGEERVLVSRFLLHLSALLEKNAKLLRSGPAEPREAYALRLGVAARGRGGAKSSGDRGVSFRTEEGLVYVVLCDGAGTGDPASAESLLAVDALTDMIRAGMPPGNAMELLNGMYVLREEVGFATMDVLELSLETGRGTLYKWGAAPSFLLSGGRVRRLGTPAPPPGLSGEYRPQRFSLELWNGDVLVLVTDGVDGEMAERLLRSVQGDNVKALAADLIDRSAEAGGEDDMTAAVIRLAERASVT